MEVDLPPPPKKKKKTVVEVMGVVSKCVEGVGGPESLSVGCSCNKFS